jgi:hypothetical protein
VCPLYRGDPAEEERVISPMRSGRAAGNDDVLQYQPAQRVSKLHVRPRVELARLFSRRFRPADGGNNTGLPKSEDQV